MAGGLPLYVVYPADGGPPKVLPQLLTPGIVVNALNRATGKSINATRRIMEINDSARESWPALMAQAQAGDRLAYTRLLKALVPVIRSQIRKRIADDALVEDVIQDVLLTVHRVRHTYDPTYPFARLMAIISARAVDARAVAAAISSGRSRRDVAGSGNVSGSAKRDSREELAGICASSLPPTSHCGACPSTRNEPDGSRRT